jgi:sugar fermentation stimulation protein A
MILDRFNNLHKLKVIERLNRFSVLLVNDSNIKYLGLLRNTGKLKDLIYPGSIVVCIKWSKPKTDYLILGVVTENGIAIIDTYTQMKIFEMLANIGYISWLKNYKISRKEIYIEDSRLDYEISSNNSRGYLELKSAVFMSDTTAMYPDTPSKRGLRHIKLLTKLSTIGYRSIIAFIASHPMAKRFRPYYEIDPEIGKALTFAKSKGVEIYSVKYYLNFDNNLVFETDNLPVDLI